MPIGISGCMQWFEFLEMSCLNWAFSTRAARLPLMQSTADFIADCWPWTALIQHFNLDFMVGM